MRVPYRSEEDIERSAEALLAEFTNDRGLVVQPPVPVEDIMEKHLKLCLGFDQLHELLGVPQVGPQPDIFGAIWVERGEILIDQSLDPDERPALEGRYRFTLAHEGGHWRLHRALLQADRRQGSLFGQAPRPGVICRTSQAKEPIEWQADSFAASLLMPRSLVYGVWHERFGHTNPLILKRKDRIPLNTIEDPALRSAFAAAEQGRDDAVLERFVRPMSARFKVSPIAMRIRLEKLGLLRRDVPRQHDLASLA